MSITGAGSNDVFSVIDPRGYTIRCTPDVWNTHILPEHDSLRGRQMDVALTIKEPEFGLVYKDRLFENRQVYYRQDGGRRLYIKAVVEVNDEARTGQLVTAFHTANKPEGEKLL